MITKMIITNDILLTQKYQKEGLIAITGALNKMIAEDQKRNVTSKIYDLNLPDVKQEKQFKDAIDKLSLENSPDYIVLIGASDVIPLQTLDMPDIEGDDDPNVPSDLPYACDHPYDTKIESFLAPTRVIGRIPDIVGSNDFSYLTNLINNASSWQSMDENFYKDYFGVSAKVWKDSTTLSVTNLYGNIDSLYLCPPNDDNWTQEQTNNLSHFINCHGAKEDTKYYGEYNGEYPTAMDSATMINRVVYGTVAAAECCYGALLFKNTEAGMPMVNAYLFARGFGFWGSTTIAYGPPSGNGDADLICQYFCKEVLKASSLGRAALGAWQTYIENESPLAPVDLKTIAQFYLLGDPSIHPVNPSKKSAFAEDDPDRFNFGREFRRLRMKIRGESLPDHVFVAKPCDERIKDFLIDDIAAITETEGMEINDIKTYRFVALNKSTHAKALQEKLSGQLMHTITSKEKLPGDLPARISILTLYEMDGKIVSYKRSDSR